MTQQNTTETYRRQNGYSDPGQENRPHKKRRRRKPVAGESATDPAAQQTETVKNTAPSAASAQKTACLTKTAQNDASQAECPQTPPFQAGTVQNTASHTESAQNTASHTEPQSSQANTAPESAQITGPQPEQAPETADPPMEPPAATPEATAAESIDYQAAYQEIYRDILENLRSFSPSDQVACSITEEHISEYLNNSHAEKVMQFKERREKRFFAALELIAVLAAIVLVIHYLQNNSAILVNILYIIAGLGALFLWKFQPRNDDRTDSASDKEAP